MSDKKKRSSSDSALDKAVAALGAERERLLYRLREVDATLAARSHFAGKTPLVVTFSHVPVRLAGGGESGRLRVRCTAHEVLPSFATEADSHEDALRLFLKKLFETAQVE